MIETTYGNQAIALDDLNAAVELQRRGRADVTTLQPGDRVAVLNHKTGLYEEHTVERSFSTFPEGHSGREHHWHVWLVDGPSFKCSPRFAGCYRLS